MSMRDENEAISNNSSSEEISPDKVVRDLREYQIEEFLRNHVETIFSVPKGKEYLIDNKKEYLMDIIKKLQPETVIADPKILRHIVDVSTGHLLTQLTKFITQFKHLLKKLLFV